MTTGIALEERFAGPALDPRLGWHCPPPRWQAGPDGLVVATAAGTDFWQRTHYGFRVDNGHALLAATDGDFVLESRVCADPVHQYDQAGLMVRLGPDDWLKTSVEFEPGEPSRLGAVVTNHGWSDWSTQDLDAEQGRDVTFRVARHGSDYVIHALVGGGRWTQLRLGRLQADQGGTVQAGLYACSPKGVGLTARFRFLTINAA